MRLSFDAWRCFAMAENKPAKKATTKSAKSTKAFTVEERAAMKARAQEIKAERRGAGKSDGESDVNA